MERLFILQMLLTKYPRLESSILDFVYVVNMTKMSVSKHKGKESEAFILMFHKTFEDMKHLYVL